MGKKVFFKIIAIFLSLSLFLEAAVYGLDRGMLRVPVNTPAERFEETCKDIGIRGADSNSIGIHRRDSEKIFKTAAGVLFTGILYKSVSLMADTMQEPLKTGHFSWGTFFIATGVVALIGSIIAIRYYKNRVKKALEDLKSSPSNDRTSNLIKLSANLSNRNKDIRNTALDDLAEFIKQEGATWVEVGLVLERLDDRDLEIKKRAIEILGSLGINLSKVGFGVKNKVVGALKKQLVYDNVRQNAIDALNKIEPESDWDELLKRMSLSLFVFYGLKESNMDGGIVMEMIIACTLIPLIIIFSIMLGKYLEKKIFWPHIQPKISKITEKYESVRSKISRLDFLKGYRHKVSPCI